MKYTLDPEYDNLQNWKVYQNVVLDIFLNEWWMRSNDVRVQLPYKVSTDGPDKTILDSEGRIVCQFLITNTSHIVLEWIRSWRDFEAIDSLGQSLRKERFYGSTT